jgi:hypothetical protein
VRKPEGNGLLERFGQGWENNITIELKYDVVHGLDSSGS